VEERERGFEWSGGGPKSGVHTNPLQTLVSTFLSDKKSKPTIQAICLLSLTKPLDWRVPKERLT
jgi:hypothetical protein